MARLAFMGSPEAAVICLRGLLEAGHDVPVVVSQPDKRRGRGGGTTPSPVRQAALEAGLEVTDKLDDVLSCGAQLGVVVAYGRIIPKRILDALPMINAHFSLLPRWRGAAPVERAILAGDAESGVCIMRLEEGLDTGPVLATRSVEIRNAEREHASSLTTRLASVASELLVDLLAAPGAIGAGQPQAGETTYAKKIEPDELEMDFTRSVVELERLVRIDRAWTTLRGKRLLVLDALARPDEEGASSSQGPASPQAGDLEPGALHDDAVRAADGMLQLILVQPAGGRVLEASQWLRGARPAAGEKLGS